MKAKKIIVLATTITAAIILAAACGKKNPEQKPGDVTIKFWCFWGEEVTNPLVEEFEKLNPDIDVEVQQLTWDQGLMMIQAAMEAGNGPDLLELGSTWVQSFAAMGDLEDLSSRVRDFRDDMVMWGPCELDGKTYAVPWMVGSRGMFYNKDLFRQAGLDPDNPPQTWDQLMDAAEKINNLGDNVYGYGMNRGENLVQYKKFMPLAWSNGGDILSADGKTCVLNSPKVQEAARFYLELAQFSLQDKQAQIDDLFKRGRVGMMISGDWMIAKIAREAPDLDFGAMMIPSPVGGNSVSFGGGEMLSILAASKNKDAAIKLLEFLIQKDRALKTAQSIGFMMPAYKGIENDPAYKDQPMVQVFARQLDHAMSPSHPQWPQIEEAMDEALERMSYSGDIGELDVACDEIDEVLNQ